VRDMETIRVSGVALVHIHTRIIAKNKYSLKGESAIPVSLPGCLGAIDRQAEPCRFGARRAVCRPASAISPRLTLDMRAPGPGRGRWPGKRQGSVHWNHVDGGAGVV